MIKKKISVNLSDREKLNIIKVVRDAQALLTLKEAFFLFNLPKHIPPNGVIVEIGSFKGGSSILLAQGSMNALKQKIYCIDPFTRDRRIFPKFLNNIKKAGVANQIIPIKKTSLRASIGWKKPINLLWIDGDHRYEFVKMDFILWEKHLIEGGIIAFHDSTDRNGFTGPVKVVKEFLVNSNWFKILGTVDSLTYAIKTKKTTSSILANVLKIIRFNIITNFQKIYLKIDYYIGRIGIFLKIYWPNLYFFLLRFKK